MNYGTLPCQQCGAEILIRKTITGPAPKCRKFGAVSAIMHFVTRLCLASFLICGSKRLRKVLGSMNQRFDCSLLLLKLVLQVNKLRNLQCVFLFFRPYGPPRRPKTSQTISRSMCQDHHVQQIFKFSNFLKLKKYNKRNKKGNPTIMTHFASESTLAAAFFFVCKANFFFILILEIVT